MFNFDYLKELLLIAIALSTITCTFIQKTKFLFKTSKFITLYSFIVNILIGIIFSITFTSITFPQSIWIGLFAFLGADSIYKSLEGKLASYSEITNHNTIEIAKANIINEEAINGKANLSK